MRYLLIGALAALLATPVLAWDGFDADSADLVEITPDSPPDPGDSITVQNRDNDTTDTCIVSSVKRNRRTTEISARCQDGASHTFVMEGL